MRLASGGECCIKRHDVVTFLFRRHLIARVILMHAGKINEGSKLDPCGG